MKVIRHDIDPKGDLLIVLKRPNTLNLMPDPPIKHESYRPALPYNRWILNVPSDNEEVKIEFRVSSLHMIRSSTFFKKMLEGAWKEALEEATGSPRLRRVSATDWNVDALTIVLNTIHDSTSKRDVPQDPNTFLLVHIAAVVDYYQCHKCTHIEAAMWQWAQNVTFHPSGDIVNLYIARVFSWQFYITFITSRVLENSHDLTLININDLPMAELLEMIERKRQEIVDQLLAHLDVLTAGILDEPPDCEDECYLLMRERLYMMFPDVPISRSLTGCSIGEVLNRVDVVAPPRERYHEYNCSITKMVRTAVNQASFQLLMGMRKGCY